MKVYTFRDDDNKTDIVIRCKEHAPYVGQLLVFPDATIIEITEAVDVQVAPGAIVKCFICDIKDRARRGEFT